MKNKILFILHIPPPVNGAAIMGGILKNSEKINNEFNSDFINLTTSFSLNQIGKSNSQKLLTTLKIQYQIIKALLTNNYTLCYITLTSSGLGFYKDLLMVLILKLFRKKIIYHFHNKGVKNNSKTVFKKKLYSFVFKNTKSILLSPLLYQDIEEYVDETNVYYCANGITDSTPAQGVQKSISLLNQNPLKFFFLSNMMRDKGVFVLLDACKILKNKNLHFECHFVGDWSEISENTFTTKIKSLEIEDYVVAHGKKYGEDKIAYFMSSDIFIFPSSNDCFPLVLIEAMQYSLPVISTFEGGIPSLVVDKKTGVLVQQNNATALAEAMYSLSIDPNKRKQMGAAGRQRYEDLYTTEHFENRIIGILNAAISD